MRISQLIKQLEDFRGHFGDVEIDFMIDGKEVNFNKIHDGYFADSTPLCEIRLEELNDAPTDRNT